MYPMKFVKTVLYDIKNYIKQGFSREIAIKKVIKKYRVYPKLNRSTVQRWMKQFGIKVGVKTRDYNLPKSA